MKSKTKNILLSLAFIVSVSISLYGGCRYGVDIAWKLYTPTFGMDSYNQALSVQIALEQLDKNNVIEAHNKLSMLLNANIITLDDLVRHEDKNSDMFVNILKRIVKHRQKYPENYSIAQIKNSDEKKIYSAIDNVLEKYSN
ncbi:MAG: hypothetical protein KQH63_06995 [Desulfobulbaceae bacterium]|nr:hypothetical protein [Desulfobulbaceae bacterium]